MGNWFIFRVLLILLIFWVFNFLIFITWNNGRRMIFYFQPLVDRYLSWFYAQETCHWRQEEGLEEEEKVMFKSRCCSLIQVLNFITDIGFCFWFAYVAFLLNCLGFRCFERFDFDEYLIYVICELNLKQIIRCSQFLFLA